VAFTRFCVLVFPLLLTLVGCETPQWAKPRATTAELRRDLADCERVATGPTPFHFWALSLSYKEAPALGSRSAKPPP
jgi:hypothetical protein